MDHTESGAGAHGDGKDQEFCAICREALTVEGRGTLQCVSLCSIHLLVLVSTICTYTFMMVLRSNRRPGAVIGECRCLLFTRQIIVVAFAFLLLHCSCFVYLGVSCHIGGRCSFVTVVRSMLLTALCGMRPPACELVRVCTLAYICV